MPPAQLSANPTFYWIGIEDLEASRMGYSETGTILVEAHIVDHDV